MHKKKFIVPMVAAFAILFGTEALAGDCETFHGRNHPCYQMTFITNNQNGQQMTYLNGQSLSPYAKIIPSSSDHRVATIELDSYIPSDPPFPAAEIKVGYENNPSTNCTFTIGVGAGHNSVGQRGPVFGVLKNSCENAQYETHTGGGGNWSYFTAHYQIFMTTKGIAK